MKGILRRLVLVSALGLACASACRSAATDPQANKDLVGRYYKEVWNQGNLHLLEELFSKSFQDHAPIADQESGYEGFRRIIVGVFGGWQEPNFVLHHLLADGDKVSARWTFEATFRPSGKKVTFGGHETWRIQDGRIVERWGTQDMMSHLQQRGLLSQRAMGDLPPPVPGMVPTEEDEETVRRYYRELWNEGNFDLFDVLFAHDFVDHSPDPGQASTLDGFRQSVLGFAGGFPDANFSIEELVVEGDKIRVNWRCKGTFTPSSTKVDFPGIEVWIVRDGKIAQRWGEYDQHKFTSPFR